MLNFSVLLLLSFIVSNLANCDGNSVQWQNNCYTFISTPAPFITAEIDCTNQGGHLVSIHDAFTNAFIAQEAVLLLTQDTSDLWLGLTTSLNPGMWSWVDGTKLDFNDFINSTIPNNQSCGSLDISNVIWKAESCNIAKPYVCQRSLTNINVTTTTTTKRISTTTRKPGKTTPKPTSCLNGWEYFDFTGFCYIYFSDMYNYIFSDQECVVYGGRSVSIHSKQEFDFVKDLTDSALIWTGLYLDGSKWAWSDGTPFDYSNWTPGYPRGKEACGTSQDGFKNANCSFDYGFVCKMLAM